MGRNVIVLSGAGVLLEIAASAVCHLIRKDSSLDELLSLTAMVCFVWAVLLFLHRNVNNPRVTGCTIGAAALLLFAGVLDVGQSMRSLDAWPIFDHLSQYTKMLHDTSVTGGLTLLLVSLALSVLQAYQAQWRLELQHTELLRETNARVLLASAVEQSADSILITDPAGVIQYVNPAFESLSGYSSDEVIGQSTTILESGKRDAQYFEDLWNTISRGDTWRGNFINKKKDGSLYEVNAVISCVRDDNGAIASYVSAQHDMTAQIHLEKQLRHAQKMEVLGTFAGHIAHDFNNILTLILGHSEMALRKLPDKDPVRGHVQHIEKAGHRASKLIRQMLAFGRQMEQECRPLAMHLVVREVLDLLRASLPSTVQLKEEVVDCGMVLADATRIHQVVMNLCTNAFQALPDRQGVLEVRLDEAKLGSGFVPDIGQLAPGTYVRLSVRDTGKGIDSSILPHIFDPFFTTKKPGEGTGLGLSTVHGIVEGYGGGIVVKSAGGRGSLFEVYLPRADGAVQPANPAQEPLTGGCERILLVDDSEEIAEMACCSLEQQGYAVTVFSSSTKALAQFRDCPHEFDLVITDQVMPQMTGTDFACELLGIRSDLPIILISGFGHGMTFEQARMIGISECLMKPFSDKTLGMAIRRALNSKDILPVAKSPAQLS